MLLEHSRTLTAVAPASITDCSDMPYSPVLLLDGRFDASLTDYVHFHRLCEAGFDGYFEATWVGGDWVIERARVYEEAAAFVRFEMLHVSPDYGIESLPIRAAFVLGWLSAFALVNRYAALRGLHLLVSLVESEQMKTSCCVA